MTTDRPTRDVEIDVLHCSMEVYDDPATRLADFDLIFRWGARNAPRISGTELSGDIAPRVIHLARSHGFRLSWRDRHDTWVAAHQDVIAGRSWRSGSIHVLDSAPAVGDPHPYSGKGITWGQWHEADIDADVALSAGHLLTKGRWRGQAQQDHPGDPVDHYAANTLYMREFGRWAHEFGDGPGRLALAGIDTNLVDSRVDVFRGADLTTIADRLDKYVQSGHGGVDVIAQFDGDRRLIPQRFRIAPIQLHSDHKPLLGTYTYRRAA